MECEGQVYRGDGIEARAGCVNGIRSSAGEISTGSYAGLCGRIPKWAVSE